MRHGRIKPTNGLILREKPNGQRLAVLPHNARVALLEEVTFYRVRTADGETGYVHGDYLELLPELVAPPVAPEQTAPPAIEFEGVNYQHPRFVGSPTRVDRDFVPALERLSGFAETLNLQVWVTSSTRNINQQVRGAIVPPATRSCHMVGHAIDMNLLHDGVLYNSHKLRRANLANLPEPVRDFIERVRAVPGLRWGGDFGTEDPVHIDDNLFHRDQILYLSKLDSRVRQLNGALASGDGSAEPLPS